jgi:hypothetical protein
MRGQTLQGGINGRRSADERHALSSHLTSLRGYDEENRKLRAELDRRGDFEGPLAPFGYVYRKGDRQQPLCPKCFQLPGGSIIGYRGQAMDNEYEFVRTCSICGNLYREPVTSPRMHLHQPRQYWE